MMGLKQKNSLLFRQKQKLCCSCVCLPMTVVKIPTYILSLLSYHEATVSSWPVIMIAQLLANISMLARTC